MYCACILFIFLLVSVYQSMPPKFTAKITAHSRASEFTEFYADNGMLFCKFCVISVSLKKSTIADHLHSKSHKEIKEAAKNKSPAGNLHFSLLSRLPKLDLNLSWILWKFAFCRISPSKTEKLKPFLQKYCKNGGSITSGKNMRDYYLPKRAEHARNTLKRLIFESSECSTPFVVNVNETTDPMGEQNVLNIIVRFGNQIALLETVFLSGPANHQTTATATCEAVIRHSNNNRNFKDFITDNTAYCYKAFTDVTTRLYPDAIWISCWAHIVDFVGDELQACFEFSTRAISLF